MKELQQPNYDLNSVACPKCGSENTAVKDNQVTDGDLGAPEVTSYVCNGCGRSFVPAMESKQIRDWSKKVRLDGHNNGKSWRD